MNRRGFLAALAGLPFVGRLFRASSPPPLTMTEVVRRQDEEERIARIHSAPRSWRHSCDCEQRWPCIMVERRTPLPVREGYYVSYQVSWKALCITCGAIIVQGGRVEEFEVS